MKIVYKNSSTPFEGVPWSGCHAFLYNEKGEICIVKAVDAERKDEWQLPGGGREEGESPEQCLAREIKEEVDCDVEDIEFMVATFADAYDDNGAEINLIEKGRGQNYKYICKATNIGEFVPNKNGFEIIDRKFVSLEKLPEYITYLEKATNGQEVFQLLKSRMTLRGY